jgi:predicted secreted protein
LPWFTAFMLYVVIWWVVLFAVLPIGVRPVSDADAVPGRWRGAPERPYLGRKVLATTLLAGLVWAGAMLLIRSDWISFRSGWLAIHDE